MAICAITPEKKYYWLNNIVNLLKTLVRNSRGKLEEDEEREEAKRELEEETGYKANHLTFITHMYGSPGFSNEKLTIYFTDNLSEGELNLDDDEFVELHKIHLDDIHAL